MGADAGLQGALGDDVAHLVHGYPEGRFQHSAAQIGALLHDSVKHGVLAEQKVSRHLGRPFTGVWIVPCYAIRTAEMTQECPGSFPAPSVLEPHFDRFGETDEEIGYHGAHRKHEGTPHG